MKKVLFNSIFCLLALGTTLQLTAQNWTVGTPVDVSLSKLTVFGWACHPTPDHNFNFPVSEIPGVQHAVIVSELTGTDTVRIEPTGSVLPGDTIWITEAGKMDVLFPTGEGTLILDFRAIGTPTEAGGEIPCSSSELWISDLLLCDEGLTPVLNFDCRVESPTSTKDYEQEGIEFFLPQAANEFQLRVEATGEIERLLVFDLHGRLISQTKSGKVNCLGLPSGPYFAVLEMKSGFWTTEKFLITGK